MGFAIPTVKIVKGGAFVTINESDFDPKVDKRYEEPAAAPPAKIPAGNAVEKPGFDLAAVVGDKLAPALVAAGFGTALAIHGATLDQLAAVPGIGKRFAESLKREAKQFVEVK